MTSSATGASKPLTREDVDAMGTITTYEESGTWTGRRQHPHNGYSSGFSPSRSQWREPERTSPTTKVVREHLVRSQTR